MARRPKQLSFRESLLNRIQDQDWASHRKHLASVFLVIGFAGIGAALMLGVPRLQARIDHEAAMTDSDIRFLNPPAWMNGGLEAWLVLTVQQELKRNPLDNADLVQARNALLDTGCFERIEQIRRVTTSEVEIEAVFLQPFAIVTDSEGDHLVDSHGRLLPAKYRVGASVHFLRITGARFNRPLRPGLQWDGADISAGLHIARLVFSREWWRQIEAIDVSNIDRITIRTSHDCHVIWGSVPGEEAVGEVTAEKKIQRLDYINSNFGRIDIDCPNELDITDPKVVTAR